MTNIIVENKAVDWRFLLGSGAPVGASYPFLESGLGSMYMDIANANDLYTKHANNGADADWEKMIVTGTPVQDGFEVGTAGYGQDVTIFGATVGKYWQWDASADKMYVLGDASTVGNSLFTGTVDVIGVLTTGVPDEGHDVRFYGDTVGKYWDWDADNDTMSVLGKTVFGTATNSLLLGAGASGANHALGSTAGNALEFYLDATHTTGDMRGEYLRLYFSGAGGSGEALRAFSTINNVSVATGGTVNGAHISLGTAGANAAVSGAANALRATFGIAAASTNIGGTCSVIQVDTDFDTAVTVPTNFAFLRFTNTNTKKSNNLMRVPTVVAETGGLFCAHTTQVMTHSLRIVAEDGTPYYVMCTDASTNRTES